MKSKSSMIGVNRIEQSKRIYAIIGGIVQKARKDGSAVSLAECRTALVDVGIHVSDPTITKYLKAAGGKKSKHGKSDQAVTKAERRSYQTTTLATAHATAMAKHYDTRKELAERLRPDQNTDASFDRGDVRKAAAFVADVGGLARANGLIKFMSEVSSLFQTVVS